MSHETVQPARPEPRPDPLVPTSPRAALTVTDPGTPGPAGFQEMIVELRTLLDRVAAAAPPAELVSEITRFAGQANARLAPWEVAESDRVAGRLNTVPGRGQLLVPAYQTDRVDDRSMAGRVWFSRHFMGSNNVVHGGAIPLLFDDVLGRLAAVDGRTRSRTAYLHADYRSVAPIEKELQIEGWFEREEGRKRFIRGVLRDGERVCTELSGLFIALKPGQP